MKLVVAKIVVLGESSVGKTSILQQYVNKMYRPGQPQTLGVSFLNCRVEIGNDTTLKLQMWDTAGEERFKGMMPMFYRGTTVALLIFSIDNRESFDRLKRWCSELRRSEGEHVIKAVLGNKIDLKNYREVSRQEGKEYAKSLGCKYFECSAKENVGIVEVFDYVTDSVMKLIPRDTTGTLQILEGDDENSMSMVKFGKLNKIYDDGDKTPVRQLALKPEKKWWKCYF